MNFNEDDKDQPAVDPPRKQYTLAELLALCDQTKPKPLAQDAWLEGPPIGRELL
jgi:antitoxin component of MazEF toxin-antitoxin module